MIFRPTVPILFATLAAALAFQVTPAAAESCPDRAPHSSEGCAQLDFAPSFVAGTISSRAGAFSPETLTVSRPDSGEEFQSLAVRNPPGLLGMLSEVGLCSGAQAVNAACPPRSQIGTVTAGLGPSFFPISVGGGVFLTGPYKGAPFGLAMAIPVGLGLFDIGSVVARATLNIDPSTAALSITSDPLPQSFDGFPLQVRSIHIKLDRPGFIFNPTSCKPSTIGATVFGSGGSIVAESSPFRATDCGSLAFRPKLSLRLSGSSARGAHPKLGAVLKMPTHNANVKGIAVTLPPSELIDGARIRNPCTAAQFAARACPSSSVIGHVRAKTPMLKAPLAGPLYLRTSSHKLPDLVATLRGQVEIDLEGRLATGKGGGIRASFGSVPDVPLSKFSLSLNGGKRSLLVNSANLCLSPPRAAVKLDGQNGSALHFGSAIASSCPGKAHGSS